MKGSVLSTYLTVFNTLDGENVLDPNNEMNIFCLHFIFVPRINEALKLFNKLGTHIAYLQKAFGLHYSYALPFLRDIDPESYGIDQCSIDCDDVCVPFLCYHMNLIVFKKLLIH